MANFLRLPTPTARQSRRTLLGLALSSDGLRLSGAVVAVYGRGVEARAELAASAAAPVPAAAGLLSAADGQGDAGGMAIGSLAAYRRELAIAQTGLAAELLGLAGSAAAEVLAVGVCERGLWTTAADGGRQVIGLADSALLAERTGLNVIDAFAARDVAAGGAGGPLSPLPHWLLLGTWDRNRIVLDLGRTLRLSYLPMARAGPSWHGVRGFDVGPGMALVDSLSRRLTGGKQPFDRGGKMAVQGRRIAELSERWLSHPSLIVPPPRWEAAGWPIEPLLADALDMAANRGWPLVDLLCTATHFLAEATATAIKRWLPLNTHVHEVILVGGGQHNGMLLAEIDERLPKTSLVRTPQFGHNGEVLEAAVAAVLAFLHLDQVPANHPAITGVDKPRVLGRLTPGSPQNWQRLVAQWTGARPSIQPLRSALA